MRPAAIVLDLQHGLWERGTVEAAIASTGQRVPVIARCADNTHAAIAQALDAGAASVLVPLIETVDDARRALDASRYPPRGSRSAAYGRCWAASPPCWKPTRRSRSA